MKYNKLILLGSAVIFIVSSFTYSTAFLKYDYLTSGGHHWNSDMEPEYSNLQEIMNVSEIFQLLSGALFVITSLYDAVGVDIIKVATKEVKPDE